MPIRMLLEKLIRVSKKQKTDFALHMNLSPSGLSKILTGTRLPPMKERRSFTRQAANYFTTAIYSPECYIKLRDIFPVIYDFESQNDLYDFLNDAITHALDIAYALENGLNLNHTGRGMYYMDSGPVINQLCVALSDCILSGNNQPLEIFASLPLSDNTYSKLFEKLVWFDTARPGKSAVNLVLSQEAASGLDGFDANGLLTLIARLQRSFDLNFYKARGKPDYFLLVKDRLLLLFYLQGTIPVLIPTYDKHHINVFYSSIVSAGNEKISHNKNEAVALVEKNPQLVDDLIHRGIDGVYNFAPVGYLLKNHELESIPCSPAVCAAVSTFFSAVLASKSTSFSVSESAMKNFSLHGKIVAPLMGAVYFSPTKRTPYMQRFSRYLTKDYYSKLKIVSSGLSGIAVLCAQEVVLIYTIDELSGQEKIHVFNSLELNRQMQSKWHKSQAHTSFSADLWEIYLDKLMHSAE